MKRVLLSIVIEKVKELISLGGLSTLLPKLHPDKSKPHSFDYDKRQYKSSVMLLFSLLDQQLIKRKFFNFIKYRFFVFVRYLFIRIFNI
mgnify:CR=1 FL=1